MLAQLYRFLWCIAPPLVKHYLKKRAKKSPDYLLHWSERFGLPITNPVTDAIWIHAVSVGETRAAEPLINALQQHYPNTPLLITQMTPTGRQTAQALYPHAQCRYLPYDHPHYVAQFFQEHRPKVGIIMETEIWPHLLLTAQKYQVPVFMANTRLSAKSLTGYLKVKSLVTPALNTLTASFTQTPADQNRLAQLTHINQYVTGNTKYDIAPPQAQLSLSNLFKQRIGHRQIVVCGSTRQDKNGIDEAQLLLAAWQQTQHPTALLVIVPRHPERFASTKKMAQDLGFTVQLRSDEQAVSAQTQVWIGDSMGELFAYYALADVVFVGGSLVDTGCQNIIEPMSCQKSTLFGPSTYNFAQVCQDALQDGAAQQISDAKAWQIAVDALLDDLPAQNQQALAAQAFVAKHQGASIKIANIISDCLLTSK